MGLTNVQSIIYSCFVLHNICETLNGNSVDDDAVGRQLEYDRLQPQTTSILSILLKGPV